jgi:hypothetical protein
VTVEDDGAGSLNLPSDFSKVRSGSRDGEGVWENRAYATDSTPVQIYLNISMGSVTIR